ncbi:N-Dimethylarginine dimethylaminohydrolase [Noviherbaspirillum humi]|uniref:N-Dimethylarginine dimethylaminohydrolase n=1 Tax=Noviherbaspirillum humi TaxID=1688639 RepID=A0A239CAK2_9BURK|nr:nitrate reductase [Noviherbaspirillum humi]SNS16494.1 N-Dimethylarginine dimethylaminohydrolase [Noviherbaspirillum humi]
MTDRYLMCAPDHFTVAYAINPWMKGNIAKDNRDMALRQWSALHGMLTRAAQVQVMPSAPGVPDMVFTANAGLVLESRVVLSRFRHVERQAEEAHFERWFRQQGMEVLRLPPELRFEGAGDALLDRGQPLLWLGHGHRSESACAPLLQQMLDIEVEPLRLVDPRFYHLDTCFCPLEGGYLIYYPAAFDAASRERIHARIPAERRIAVISADAAAFACNAVNTGHYVFLNRASAILVKELRSRGFIPRQTPLGEFMKAGGAAKCLTLKLNEARLAPARSVA